MSLTVAATLSPSAYWYLARGTGAVSLVLLTASVVLGILGSVRFAAPRWPRFAIDAVHRDVSLLVVVVLVIHIVTSVLDGFAPIRLFDGVIPFVTPYRPLWMGLGTLSFDLLLAHRDHQPGAAPAGLSGLAGGALARVRQLAGRGAARAGHRQRRQAVVDARADRSVHRGRAGRGVDPIASVSSDQVGLRAPATALAVITPIGLAVFTLAGPLQHGWARRAGTPSSLLGRTVASVAPAPRASSAVGLAVVAGRVGLVAAVKSTRESVHRTVGGSVDRVAGAGRSDRRPRPAPSVAGYTAGCGSGSAACRSPAAPACR